MRDYGDVNCDVAREALSARIDGEREPVPAARVDEHLEGCAECRDWRDRSAAQADVLRRLARRQPVTAVPDASPRPGVSSPPARIGWQRWVLLAVGLAQCAVGGAQAFGVELGLQHGPHTGAAHLFNESTAWTLALGVVMLAAAWRPALAAGLSVVLAAFAAVLAVYVVVDASAGAVTPGRVLSHLPVLLGAIVALLVWRRAPAPPPAPRQAAQGSDITLPRNASRGRRRGHLWPTDGSAA